MSLNPNHWFFLVSGYTPGTPYKVSCSPTSGAVPPYSSSPNPYQTAVYPVRSAYPQQSPYAQVGLGWGVLCWYLWEGWFPVECSYAPDTRPCGNCFSFSQQGTYYTQPLYAAPPHVIHHTTVVQPNGMPATVYPAPIPPPRGNGVTMGMVAGTTMAMSAGKSLILRLVIYGDWRTVGGVKREFTVLFAILTIFWLSFCP